MSNTPLSFVRNRIPLLRELPIEVTALSAIAFCVALGFGIVAPVIPAFAREFDVTAFEASAVVSVFAGMRLISAPPAAKLLDYFGERLVLSIGLLIVAVSSALAGLSQTYIQLVVLRGVGGFGSTMFTVASMALLLRVVDATQRGRASSAWSGGFLVGGLAGPAVGGIFAGISLRAPFFVYATTLLAAAFVSWSSLKHAHLIDGPQKIDEPKTTGAFAKLLIALKQRAYIACVSVNLSNGFVRFGLLNALAPLFVVEALHESVSMASTGFLLSAIGQAALLSRAGTWTDTWGRKPVLLLGISLSAVAMIVMAIIETTPAYLCAMFLLGLGGAFLSSAPAAVLGDVTGGHPRGPVVATYQMSSDFGAIFGPLLGGYLLDQTGFFDTPLLAGATLLLIVLLLVIRMPETLEKKFIEK
ncbi:MAG: hypothetical protein RIS75_868 [Actinomycetota bacterium]